MTPKICYRCDWQGVTTEPKCPQCGVPLYVVSAVQSGETTTANVAPPDTGSLHANPTLSPTDAVDSSSRSDVDPRPQHEKPPAQENRNKKIGGFAVAAAIGMAAVALILVTRGGENSKAPAAESPTVNHPIDLSVASKFVRAFGAFNGERAITYLSDNPRLEMDATTPEQVPVFTSFLEAQGYTQILDEECSETGSSASGTAVHCGFDWHAIRSDEIGLGPYPGDWTLTVRDGEIVSVALHWEIERFSPQMWEPFRDWVAASYPKDFDVMYARGGSNFLLTEESTRLWEQHSRGYVKEVRRRMETHAGAPEVDYMVDLSTGKKTLLPKAIIQSLGETADGRWAESQYAAQPNGSLLAYVGTGDKGSPQIFIGHLDGTGVRQMTHDPTGAISPAWSPDGTMIAYQGGGGDLRDIFVLDVATGESTQIADGVAFPWGGLQFTPDGSSIVHTGRTDSYRYRSYPVVRTNSVAGGQVKILFGRNHGGMAGAANGSLSPDGSLVTMIGSEIGGPGAIRFVANVDGTELRHIRGRGSNPAGAWSPDGSRIVCLQRDKAHSGIIVVDIATGKASGPPVAEGSAAIWLDGHTLLVEV
jgi:Tol biopolymer transport system component